MYTAISIILFIVFVIWVISPSGRKQVKASVARPNNIRVVRVKGERAAEREIAKHLARGYHLEASSARKSLYSPLTGVFTRKQIHTLTFTKD